MAHNLNIKKGKASFFTAKEPAWHGLGTVTKEALTSLEAIKAAQLDYEVGLEEVYVPVKSILDLDTKYHEQVLRLSIYQNNTYYKASKVPDKFATYRKDTGQVFGIVGSRYEVIQNSTAFEFMDSIVGEGKAQYETAGALGKGETIFITAKLPDTLLVKGKDAIDQYLLFTSSHDDSGSIQILFTPIRVVCNNTLNMALQGSKFKMTVKHTKNAQQKLKLATEILEITKKAGVELVSTLNSFADTIIQDLELEQYIIKSLGLVGGEDGKLTVRSNNIYNDVLQFYE